MYRNGKNITFIDRSVECVNLYLHNIRKAKPLTNEAEYELWLSMQQGSSSAREQLIFANLPYVVSVAKKYLPSGAALEDLIQAGNEGLVRAVDKFDASLGYRLISFATWFIENEVHKAAYEYIRHDADSLDESITEDKDDEARSNFVKAHPSQSADWNLRYRDALQALKQRLEKRQFGLGRLVGELHQMLLDGYTTSDFARKHRLNERQMNHLFTLIREEVDPLPKKAA